MAQQILVDYNASVDKLIDQLNKVASANENLSDSAKETNADIKKSTITQEQAAKKRLELLKKEEAELKRLQAARKLAYDPKVIAEFDRKIAASQQKIALLGKQSSQALGGVSKQITSIGAGIATALGAAFTVDALINFSKASVNAFLEAQENAEKLRFTITQVGGESELAFQRLIDQSQQLQDITIFSDDSIQQAQNALATFGLTSDQIEELLPKLADFASATKTDIVQAAQQVGAGLEGAGREFKKYGIEVSATASRLENLNEITDGFAKFQGAAAKETETLTGQLKQQANAADDLQESIGARLAEGFVKAKLAAFNFFATVLDGLEGVEKQNAKNDLSDRERLEQRIKADLQGKATINNLSLQVNAEKELAKTGEALRKNQKEIIENEIKQNPQRLTQLEKQREELEQTAGILTEIINLEKNRIENEKKLAAQNVKQADTSRDEALLRKLQIENIEDLKQRRIAAFEEEARTLTAKGKLRNAILVELEKQLKKDLDEIDKTLGNKIKPIELKVKLVVDEIVPVNEIAEKLEDRTGTKEFVDGIEAVEAQTFAAFLENNAEIISGTQELLSSLLGLYQQYNDQKIAAIDKETDATLQALDEQESAVDKNLKNRRISEREAQKEKEQIERERVKVEEEAQRKIRAIKRREFNLNKIAALSEIAIETAKNVTKAPIQLKPYFVGLGLAQAAIVTAQPNPYRKGSKDTGSKEHLALVGEEGPELMMMQPHSKILPAAQTKTYGEAIEAMRKKQFDAYISEKYITPALIAQQKQHEKTKSKSFADNLSSSIVNNYTSPSGRGDYLLEKISKGIPVSNISEIADALKSNRSYKR